MAIVSIAPKDMGHRAFSDKTIMCKKKKKTVSVEA
jgi:hypothetical protein